MHFQDVESSFIFVQQVVSLKSDSTSSSAAVSNKLGPEDVLLVSPRHCLTSLSLDVMRIIGNLYSQSRFCTWTMILALIN